MGRLCAVKEGQVTQSIGPVCYPVQVALRSEGKVSGAETAVSWMALMEGMAYPYGADEPRKKQ
jgi:hypothetical protein